MKTCPECGKENDDPEVEIHYATEFVALGSFICEACGALVDLSFGGAMIVRSTPASELV